MIVITLSERCPRINITDDKTFGEVRIEGRDYDHEKELLIDLVERLLKNND